MHRRGVRVLSGVIDLAKAALGTGLTGFAMYCIWDLEREALAAGINGSQFMYVIAGIALLGGVTLAPVIEIVKKIGGGSGGGE